MYYYILNIYNNIYLYTINYLFLFITTEPAAQQIHYNHQSIVSLLYNEFQPSDDKSKFLEHINIIYSRPVELVSSTD